jgi:hypothetical protein
MFAAMNGDVDCMIALYNECVDIDISIKSKHWGMDALHIAC